MDLMFGLATVDKMQGDRLGRQLAHGWMGWESKRGRQLRMFGAHVLIAVATWLTPDDSQPTDIGRTIAGTTGA